MTRRTFAQQEQTEKGKLEEEHAVISGEITAAKNELVEVGKTKKEIEATIVEAQEKKKALIDEKQALEKQIADLKATRDNELADHEVFLKTIANKKESLQNDLPDTKAVLADLESQKYPIQKEITDLKIERESVSKELNLLRVECDSKKEESHIFDADIQAKSVRLGDLNVEVVNKNITVLNLDKKKAEHDDYVARIGTSIEVISANQKKIDEQEARLASLRTETAQAETHLVEVKAETTKTTEEANAKIRTLSLLENRVDGKLEIFKAYKEKFTVDDLAKMKINPDITK